MLVGLHRRVSVWINHGDRFNTQNVGCRGWDDPGAPNGHVDQMRLAGVRWLWVSSLTDTIGQSAHRLQRPSFGRLKNDWLRPTKRVLAGTSVGNPFHFNRVTQSFRDEQGAFRTFVRFGFWHKASSEDFSVLVEDATLDRLERMQGYAVVYVHLYKRRQATRISDVDWSGFQRLAMREKRGTLKVTTTSRLLRYHDAVSNLRWRSSRRGSNLEIHIDAASSESLGETDREQLQGLTFYVDDPERSTLYANGRMIENTQANPPDETGRPSIGIPWRPLVPVDLDA